MNVLQIQAGKHALAHIRKHGLSPGDISAVFGASGAAKWLGIYGLDRAIFSDWLSQSRQPVAVLGTSVGALKLAAAVQPDCRSRLAEFATRYIEQTFDGAPTVVAVERETNAVIDVALANDGEGHLLDHPRYQYHCAAVHVGGRLADSGQRSQVAGMVGLAGASLRGRKQLLKRLTRVIFSSPAGSVFSSTDDASGIGFPISSQESVDTLHFPLDHGNLRTALRASGAIPVYISAVHLAQSEKTTVVSRDRQHYQGRRSDKTLILRDGGLLDYHPIPSNLSASQHGLVLYPHFYSSLKESWFDKFYRWRKVPAHKLDNVILVSPTQEFVRSLPGARIPDRRDFVAYQNRDAIRIKRWREAADRTEELGDAWMEIAARGEWANVVTPFR